MREWGQGIRKRRERQVRAIRGGSHLGRGMKEWEKGEWTSGDVTPWNRPGPWNEKPNRKESRFLIQLFFSFLLLTITYLIFQSDTPAGRQAQAFVVQVMERDFNFAGVAEWYERQFAGAPSFLPVFTSEPVRNDRKGEPAWVVPVQGKVARPFSSDGRGIVISTDRAGFVAASAEGLVVFAGEKEGLGKTVILRHPGGKETWYGWLDQFRVQADDWVKPGDPIGSIGKRTGQPMLYFALRMSGRFVDPKDVIPLE